MKVTPLVPVIIKAPFVVARELRKYGVAGAGGVTLAVTEVLVGFKRNTGIASLPLRLHAIAQKSTESLVWSITFQK